MTAGREIVTHLSIVARFLKLDATAAEELGNTPAAARRSFVTLWWRFPYYVIIGYFSNLPNFARYDFPAGPFILVRCTLFFFALALTLSAVHIICQWEGLQDKFHRWVVGFNWGRVLLEMLLLPFSLAPAFVPVSRDAQVTNMVVAYFFMIWFMWAMSWRTLKCNPFLAAGIAITPFLVEGLAADYLNTRMYGVARPFFDP